MGDYVVSIQGDVDESWSANFLQFDTLDGDLIFDARIIDARAVWQFNVRSFLRFTLHYEDLFHNGWKQLC